MAIELRPTARATRNRRLEPETQRPRAERWLEVGASRGVDVHVQCDGAANYSAVYRQFAGALRTTYSLVPVRLRRAVRASLITAVPARAALMRGSLQACIGSRQSGARVET